MASTESMISVVLFFVKYSSFSPSNLSLKPSKLWRSLQSSFLDLDFSTINPLGISSNPAITYNKGHTFYPLKRWTEFPFRFLFQLLSKFIFCVYNYVIIYNFNVLDYALYVMLQETCFDVFILGVFLIKRVFQSFYANFIFFQ